MSNEDADQSEFKPFFDLTVGVLFILLILISAQMLFLQNPLEISNNDQTAQQRLDRAKQVSIFLEDVAGRLRKNGLVAELSLNDRSISLLLSQFLDEQAGGLPKPSERAIAAFTTAIVGPLSCVSRDNIAGPQCLALPLLRIGDVSITLEGQAFAQPAAIPSDRYLSFVATVLSAAILTHTPEVIALTGSAGQPLVRILSYASSANLSRPTVKMTFVFE